MQVRAFERHIPLTFAQNKGNHYSVSYLDILK